MIQCINLEGLIGKRAALHNGEDWGDYIYEIVGYALEAEEGRQYVILYLLKFGGNGMPITRRFQDIKIECAVPVAREEEPIKKEEETIC